MDGSLVIMADVCTAEGVVLDISEEDMISSPMSGDDIFEVSLADVSITDIVADGAYGIPDENSNGYASGCGGYASYAEDDIADRIALADLETEYPFHSESGVCAVPFEELDKQHLGCLRSVDEFVAAVGSGDIAGCDGWGEFVSGDGAEHLIVEADVRWLEYFRDEWPYVAWYGK